MGDAPLALFAACDDKKKKIVQKSPTFTVSPAEPQLPFFLCLIAIKFSSQKGPREGARGCISAVHT